MFSGWLLYQTQGQCYISAGVGLGSSAAHRTRAVHSGDLDRFVRRQLAFRVVLNERPHSATAITTLLYYVLQLHPTQLPQISAWSIMKFRNGLRKGEDRKYFVF